MIPWKVIGGMRMIDRGKADDKINAYAEQVASESHIDNVNEFPEFFRVELKHFSGNYKTFENRKVVVDDFLSKQHALPIIERSIAFYRETYPK
jgi:inorganic pyrophosphatase